MRCVPRSTVLLTAGLSVLAGCDVSSGPEVVARPGLSVTWSDGTVQQTAGLPTFQGGELAAGTFAIAFPDSVGGLVMASFRQTDGTRGDLFILQLTERRRGDFGPCGITQNCHGRLLADIDAENLQDVGAAWEIGGGSVHVDDSGPERVAGSFADIVLQAQGSAEPDQTVDGTFDLPLLPEDEGAAIMRCFLRRATGSSC